MNKSNFKARMNWINRIREYRSKKARRRLIEFVADFLPQIKQN